MIMPTWLEANLLKLRLKETALESVLALVQALASRMCYCIVAGSGAGVGFREMR